MNVDAPAVVTQLGEDYATDLASKTQQIALLKVQVKTLQDQLNSQKEGFVATAEGEYEALSFKDLKAKVQSLIVTNLGGTVTKG